MKITYCLISLVFIFEKQSESTVIEEEQFWCELY